VETVGKTNGIEQAETFFMSRRVAARAALWVGLQGRVVS